jgi:predicted hydrocarbon binding protein
MGVKEASDEIMKIIFEHIPNDKCDCIFIDDIFLGVSVSINEKYVKSRIVKNILHKCNKEYGNYIESVDFIEDDKSLFNIYLHGHNYIREKKISKINRLI